MHALKAGREFEFELDAPDDLYNWADESNNVIDYEKIFKHRNMDMVNCGGDNEDGDGEEDVNNGGKQKQNFCTPFERLTEKMVCITPDDENGVVKRVLENGTGVVIPNGSRVRSW